MNMTLDHLKVREMASHELRVAEIQQGAKHWRLTDCDEPTLEQMRHNLLATMEALERELDATNQQFLRYVQNGRPLETERVRESIDQLANEWSRHNLHLQEIDEAVLERHLQTALERTLGSKLLVNILDMIVLTSILVIVVLTLIEFLFPQPAHIIATISQLDLIISLFLIADFALRFSLAEDRRWYLRRYWIDLAASLPASQMLKFGRLLHLARFVPLLRLLRLGRAMRVLRYAFRGFDKLFATFEINLLRRALWIAGVLLCVGALSIALLEGEQEPALQTMQQSLWWSFTTVVTGGFADLYNPSTVSGQLVTVGLVLLGLTVTGIFTASLTSVLVEDDGSRIEGKQREMQLSLDDLNQKLDLLSGETNEGLIALETVAQALSNQQSAAAIAEVLTGAMLNNFTAVQASVHLLDGKNGRFSQLSNGGQTDLAPLDQPLSSGSFISQVLSELLHESNLAAVDIEPYTEPTPAGNGLVMICPLVANRQLLGALHAVLPAQKGRYYLYNRAPMTLAHHAAIAIFASQLACEEQETAV